MSTQTTEATTGAQAYDAIFQRVYVPTFFQKLSHVYGIVPANQAEAESLLRVAGKLRNAHDLAMAKQASAARSPLLSLEERLDARLGKTADAHKAAEDQMFTEYAAKLASDKGLADAVLAYQNAVAADIKAQQA